MIRQHVALLAPPSVSAPDRKGRAHVSIGRGDFGVDADEMVRLQPLLAEITEAIERTGRRGSTS